MRTLFAPIAGTRVTTRVAFRTTVGGALADPGIVTCRVKNPAGTVSSYITPYVIRDSVGEFHFDFSVTAEGWWTVQWVASGSGPNVVKNLSFLAQSSAL